MDILKKIGRLVALLPIIVIMLSAGVGMITSYAQTDTVKKPVAMPDSCTFYSSISVSLSCETPGATIYYNLNSDDVAYPAEEFKYDGAIELFDTTTITAYAVKDGMKDSETLSVTYTKGTKEFITIAPPKASVESGKVPCFTQVVFSCESPEGYLAYSINGGEFVYTNVRNKSFTLTEDTVITVKGWTDKEEEGKKYITPESVYTYTVDNKDEYPYSIEAIAVTNDVGEILTKPPMDTGFIVDVTLKEIKERDAHDQMFVAVYDKNGRLLSLDYVRCNLAADSEFSIGFYIPPQDAAVGSVKAFIWNSFDTPEPLAASAELRF